MKVIIFGNTDLAELAYFYLKNDSSYIPIGFCADGKYIRESTFQDLPIVPTEEVLDVFLPVDTYFFCPIIDNKLRQEKFNYFNQFYKFITYVSSKASVWSKIIGQNCFILENNVIQPKAKIGDNVIMWSGNHIGHDSEVRDHCFFTSHVVLSGHCTVDPYCYFGVNSSIRDNTRIKEGTFVGMGSVVTKDTEPWSKYVGVPAKRIGNNP